MYLGIQLAHFLRPTLFYGWIILLIAVLAQIMTAPGQTVGVSEFKDQFGENLQLSSRSVALYYCYGTAIGSLGLPIFGFLIDRFGCRFTLCLVTILLSATCFFLGNPQTLFGLLVVFTLLRMLGQGALSLVASTMVSLWFRRRLALAYSVMSVGSGLGMMMIPYIFKPLFQGQSLDAAFGWIALGVLALFPIGLLLVINRPQKLGLSQDGEPISVTDESETTEEELNQGNDEDSYGITDFTFREAISTSAFWIVTAAQAAWALVGTGLVFNRKDIFQAINASEQIVDLAVPGLFGAVIISQLITGLVARKFSHATLFVTGSLGMSIACWLVFCQTPWLAFCGFILFGLSQGIFIIMGQSLWADFYGRQHIGKIRGLVWMIVVAASSLGGFALTLGESEDTRFIPIQIAAVLMLILATLCLAIRQPNRPQTDTD